MPVTPPVFVPGLGHEVVFQDRPQMYRGQSINRYRVSPDLPTPVLPIDWAKNLQFPILGNNQYGDCMYAMALHVDQTWTGNNGAESSFDVQVVIRDYLRLSGGDNGLDEGTLVHAWKKGLALNKDVAILDALDIDPTNGAMVQSAMYLFGAINFMLSVPNAWINSFDPAGGQVWDAPARANPANGHGVAWNGCDTQGRYKLQTWGGWVWITPAGVRTCDPSAFITFSLRWFDQKTGKAPNGYTYDQLAAFWVQAGGAVLPPWPYGPIPVPPGPTPVPPGPTPTPSVGIIYVDTAAHVVSLPDGWSVVPLRKA